MHMYIFKWSYVTRDMAQTSRTQYENCSMKFFVKYQAPLSSVFALMLMLMGVVEAKKKKKKRGPLSVY